MKHGTSRSQVAEGLRATVGTQPLVAAPSGHGILGAGGTERQQERWQHQEVHGPTCCQQTQRTQTHTARPHSPKNPRHPSFWSVPEQEGREKKNNKNGLELFSLPSHSLPYLLFEKHNLSVYYQEIQTL